MSPNRFGSPGRRTRVVLLAVLALGGAQVLSAQGTGPVAWWTMDEMRDDTTEDVAGRTLDHVGGGVRVVPGVNGQALLFDGFRSFVRREAEQAPSLADGFTVQCWVALGAYPWAWGPVVDHRGPDKTGFTFGVDARGRGGVRLAGAEGEQVLIGDEQVPLRKWVHLAVTCDPAGGLVLYRDGELEGRLDLAGAYRPATGQPLYLGRNYTQEAWEDFQLTTEGKYSCLDGLLDEVKIHDRALSSAEIAAAARMFEPTQPAPFPVRKFPDVHSEAGAFGAFYTKLDYYQEWDALWRVSDVADVLVRFEGTSSKLVFWRGMSYVPCWVTENGIWFTNEWLETWGEDVRSCAEPIMDRDCRHSHVRIVESNDARTIVHWRYALVDAYYDFAAVGDDGRGEWCDEFYVTYPDGTGVRKMVLHYTEPLRNHDWAEQIVVLPPGRTPGDVIASPEVVLVNMKGEEHAYTWSDELAVEMEEPAGANIEVINLKAAHRPFLILPPDPFSTTEMTRESPFFRSYCAAMGKNWRPDPVPSVFGWWNHWPIAQVPGDGRWVLDPDRASHFNLTTFLQWKDHELTDRTKTRLMLQGLTDRAPADLVPLAKSWLEPPALALTGMGYGFAGYDQAQRAYVLTCETPGRPAALAIDLDASPESPIVNLALVVEGWGRGAPSVQRNGELLASPADYRVGHVSRLDGDDLVLWLPLETTEPFSLTIEP